MDIKMINVSIIMPTYNRGHCIKDAIQSVIDQSYQDWELIICDDYSKDNTKEVVLKFQDERIRYYRNSKNLGLPQNRNVGINLAYSRLIMFWEDDIIADKNCLLVLMNTFNLLETLGFNIGAVSPKAITKTKEGKLISLENLVASDIKSKLDKPSIISKWTGLIYENFGINTSGVIETDVVCPWSLFNKSAIKEVGGYSSLFGKIVGYSHEETDLFVRLRKSGYLLYYQPNAVSYHNQSKTGGTRVKFGRYCWNYISSHVLFLVKDFGVRSIYMIPSCFGYLLFNVIKYSPRLIKSN